MEKRRKIKMGHKVAHVLGTNLSTECAKYGYRCCERMNKAMYDKLYMFIIGLLTGLSIGLVWSVFFI